MKIALGAARLGDWSWDTKTDLVTLSVRAAEIFAVPPEACMTWAALRELLHPDDREATRLAVQEATTGHKDYAVEYRLTNGGRERWVSASGCAQYGADGEVLGMFGVVQDLTRDRVLMRIDDALRPLVVSEDITYTAARVLGHYLDVNRCAYAFVEDDQDTFTLTGNYTNGVESIVGTYRFRQFGAECLRLMRAGEPYVVTDSEDDARIDDEDRKAYRLTAIRAVICVPISKGGRFVAAMAVHMQLARSWTKLEVELLQQVASRCWESIERARVESERAGLLEAAEAANRAKDEFLAMLGHELRNPLAPIVTALLLMKMSGERAFERERTVIERQVAHVSRLVDDLLDVSRIARGKVELKQGRVDVADVIAQAIEVASPLLEQRGHVVEWEVPRDPLTLNGDAARLVQVFSNLLTNAAKYTPDGGQIGVSAATEGDDVVVRVRDDGIGMEPEVLAHIFSLFVQRQQSIDRARGGLGLGLSIVRGLVDAHGGRVSAHSEGPNQGSEFVVHLPRAPKGEASLSQPADSAKLGSVGPALRILVVDDNVDGAEMLAAALDVQGCEVSLAHDGPAALRIATQHTFDAALLDIGLPIMDGYELAAKLQELPGMRSARFVAVTGYGQDTDRRKTKNAGFDEHLVKPIDFNRLADILLEIVAARAVEAARLP